MRPTVTIVAVTTRRVEEHTEAMRRTAEALPFHPKEMLLVAPYSPDPMFSWVEIKPWFLPEFNRYQVERLHDHIHTDYALTVHWDGYGVNADKWTDDFFNYDYIGAPWPRWIAETNRIGNGGLSLRSRRWLKQAALLGNPDGKTEDVWQCRTNASWFLDAGLRVAPLKTAMQFSYENPLKEFPNWKPSDSFGFHSFVHPDTEQFRLSKPGLKERVHLKLRRLRARVGI